MKNKVVAKRYAEAYMAFAEPKIGLARCVQDMKDIRTVLRQNPDLLEFFRAPEVPRAEKGAVLDRVLGDVLSDETRTFIKYLLGKGRVTILASIAEYIRVVYSHGEVVDVVLRTTFPMELEIIGRIKAQVEAFARSKVNLYLELDPDLLGGAQVVVGHTIIDGSVRNRLAQLKKQMMQAKVGS